MKRTHDLLVVGAGLFGATIAEHAIRAGLSVLVVEKRSYVGGYCHTRLDPETSLMIHSHGAHVFHTKSRRIWEYITRFGTFAPYVHKVESELRGERYPLPINLTGVNKLFDVSLVAASEMRAFLDAQTTFVGEPRNFEDKVVKAIGRRLYETFVEGYTEKQVGTHPRDLPPTWRFRARIRYEDSDNYFDDEFQGLPVDGYTEIIRRMFQGADIEFNVDFLADRDAWQKRARKTIYCGPLDRYFDYMHGILGWRKVVFESTTCAASSGQSVAVVNHQDADIPYSRVADMQYFQQNRPEEHRQTVLLKERHLNVSDAAAAHRHDAILKPRNSAKDLALMDLYRVESRRVQGTVFGGRVADYQHYDMDHTIGLAIKVARRIIKGAT